MLLSLDRSLHYLVKSLVFLSTHASSAWIWIDESELQY